MKIYTWNVNGIRSVNKKGFSDFIKKEEPDVLFLQEIKANPDIIVDHKLDNYELYYMLAQKPGYSGVAIYTKNKPVNVIYGISDKDFDSEGRLIAIELENLFLVNIYLPHTGRKLEKLDKKIKFNNLFAKFIRKLEKRKPVIIGGDFNVAHTEIDLANPKNNVKNAGFTLEERSWFDQFLSTGYVDLFRRLNGKKIQYTWWSHRFNARVRNIGWRVDYFICSQKIAHKIKKCEILDQTLGSDHCPVKIEL